MAQVTIFAVLAFCLAFCTAVKTEAAPSGSDNWDALLAKRVVFAVDTSASMLLDVSRKLLYFQYLKLLNILESTKQHPAIYNLNCFYLGQWQTHKLESKIYCS